jgi:7-keto-8-aminopelargonate synthetase-like enzyme
VLAQRSRPQLLRENTTFFRAGLKRLGFEPLDGEAAIIPIIVGETAFAIRLSACSKKACS